MKTIKHIAVVLLAAVASVVAIQWVIKKLHVSWNGGREYDSLYDVSQYRNYPSSEHMARIEKRFNEQ